MNQYLIAAALILLLAALAVIALFFFAWSAKKTLIRGGTTWSAKDFPIKRKSYTSANNRANNIESSSLLESISDQTSEYLSSEDYRQPKSLLKLV